ncbi:hypothetical protein QTP88_001937 [Uroleucon formosanum]
MHCVTVNFQIGTFSVLDRVTSRSRQFVYDLPTIYEMPSNKPINFKKDNISISNSSSSSDEEAFSNVLANNLQKSFEKDFVIEAIGLYNKDITICGKKTRFEIQMLLFDAVAKASVLQIKGHSGYSSCSKCTAEGEYLNGRMCFPDITFIERTDNDFKNQTNENHHVGQTILTRIPGLNLVSNVPLDYLHLILLGVMKKLLVGTWIFGKPPHKLPSRIIDEMST